jgi:Domain of unknown function (DUF6916)
MLETLTLDTFSRCIGQDFHVTSDNGHAPLRLASAEDLRENPGADGDATRRTPFSLLFHGPANPFLPQGTYPLRHDAIGDFQLFLVPLGPVPIGPEKGLMRYEAIFT